MSSYYSYILTRNSDIVDIDPAFPIPAMSGTSGTTRTTTSKSKGGNLLELEEDNKSTVKGITDSQ